MFEHLGGSVKVGVLHGAPQQSRGVTKTEPGEGGRRGRREGEEEVEGKEEGKRIDQLGAGRSKYTGRSRHGRQVAGRLVKLWLR